MAQWLPIPAGFRPTVREYRRFLPLAAEAGPFLELHALLHVMAPAKPLRFEKSKLRVAVYLQQTPHFGGQFVKCGAYCILRCWLQRNRAAGVTGFPRDHVDRKLCQ